MTSSQPPLKIRISAPGKVILHGEHSVVYNKLAVAASLGLRTQLEYSEEVERQNVVALDFPAVNMLHFYHVQDLQDFIDKPLPLIKSPCTYNFTHPELLDHEEILASIATFIAEKSGSHRLEANQQLAFTSFLYLLWAFLGPMNIQLTHFKLRVKSELTVSAGTGSSASFAVVIVAFFLQFIRLRKLKPKDNYKGFNITNPNLESFDKKELELISKWAFQSERIIHGTPSGVDNTICTYGGLVQFRKGTLPLLIELATKFTTILINTKLPRDTKRLVSMVAERREKYKSIIDGILNSMDQVSTRALQCMQKINTKTLNDFELLNSYETLGELTDLNQNLLRCLGVSHPKLDEICFVLSNNGLHGKLTGAGGGGYAICLVPPHFDKVVVKKIMEELKLKEFDAVLTDLGGCGVSIDSL
ncbi:hypothetical protein Zmor_018018 [Zophobas morio]|uniref:Mevalonate kinase n=1 Tax=Zophobas morio TaxID=2755281 RepID=A0AA38IDL3_9CUCU|nr:hypothetical protein Zmor_018018 [Zophobas morio]